MCLYDLLIANMSKRGAISDFVRMVLPTQQLVGFADLLDGSGAGNVENRIIIGCHIYNQQISNTSFPLYNLFWQDGKQRIQTRIQQKGARNVQKYTRYGTNIYKAQEAFDKCPVIQACDLIWKGQ